MKKLNLKSAILPVKNLDFFYIILIYEKNLNLFPLLPTFLNMAGEIRLGSKSKASRAGAVKTDLTQ
jgi:hypothetical protein